MKKNLLPLLMLFLTLAACGPSIYKSQNFDEITTTHKTVAILPSDVIIELRPNEMKKTTSAQITEMEEKTGLSIQDKMYSWFLRRSNRFKYTVNFQDISKTNALLLKSGITYSDMRSKTKEEIAQILGVDAVISTRASMKKPMSEGAALAVGILAGTWGNTNDVQTTISINEAKKGDLVWKYDYNSSGSVGSNTDKLVNALMRNASKKFPYNDK